MSGIKDNAITIYNKLYNPELRDNEWHSKVVDRCSWHSRQESTVSERGLFIADIFIVRIFNTEAFVEADKYYGEGWTLCEGDVIVQGAHTLSIEKPSDITSKHTQSMTVTSVTDNRRGSKRMQHILAKGE